MRALRDLTVTLAGAGVIAVELWAGWVSTPLTFVALTLLGWPIIVADLRRTRRRRARFIGGVQRRYSTITYASPVIRVDESFTARQLTEIARAATPRFSEAMIRSIDAERRARGDAVHPTERGHASAQERLAAQRVEYGQYVARQDIRIPGTDAFAFRRGDPVPVSIIEPQGWVSGASVSLRDPRDLIPLSVPALPHPAFRNGFDDVPLLPDLPEFPEPVSVIDLPDVPKADAERAHRLADLSRKFVRLGCTPECAGQDHTVRCDVCRSYAIAARRLAEALTRYPWDRDAAEAEHAAAETAMRDEFADDLREG